VRKTPALLSAVAVAAVLVASLVGCSSSPSAACTPSYASGAASKIVTVSGSVKAPAKATFPTPLIAKSSQVSVDKVGTGGVILPGDQVDFEYSVFSGKTGEFLGSSGYGKNGATTPRAGIAPTEFDTTSGKYVPTHALIRSLQCQTAGGRYTLVTTAAAGFGRDALASNGVANTDTLVIVVSPFDHFLGKANGTNQLPLDGMPSVITAVNGQPGIVIQEIDKPKDLRISTIKAGAGATVKKRETVRVKFTGWTWPTSSSDKPQVWPAGQQSDGSATPDGQSTWTNNRATDVPVTASALPPGLYKALLGAKVGSQVLAVIPPKAGFGSQSALHGFSDTDTVIMVIDVLGIA